MKILIVGAGVTGALISSLLRRNFLSLNQRIIPTSADVQGTGVPLSVSVWDKSRGAGGRMCTTRMNNNMNTEVKIDVGAQYISAVPDYQEKHGNWYTELLKNGVLVPLKGEIEGSREYPDGTCHFVAPDGMNTISKYFLQQAEVEPSYHHQVYELEQIGKKWLARCVSGTEDCFDCIFVTIPIPQILNLKGMERCLKTDLVQNLQRASYSARFVLSIALPEGFDVPVNWTGKYIQDNDCVRFIAIDTRKRQQDVCYGDALTSASSSNVGNFLMCMDFADTSSHSILVHTSVPYALEHLEEDKVVITHKILPYVREVLPWLPSDELIRFKGHKWRYSQVHKAVEGKPGCEVVNDFPPLILSGDGFTHSNMDGCIVSASAAIKALTQCVMKS